MQVASDVVAGVADQSSIEPHRSNNSSHSIVEESVLDKNLNSTMTQARALFHSTRKCRSRGFFCGPGRDPCCEGLTCSNKPLSLFYTCSPNTKTRTFPLTKTRSFDGSDNNEGAKAHAILRRKAVANYPGDGTGSTVREYPNPREVSRKVLRQTSSIKNARGLSDYIWAFGQFLE